MLILLGAVCAAIWLGLGTFWELPVSSSLSMTGAIIGICVAAGGVQSIHWNKVTWGRPTRYSKARPFIVISYLNWEGPIALSQRYFAVKGHLNSSVSYVLLVLLQLGSVMEPISAWSQIFWKVAPNWRCCCTCWGLNIFFIKCAARIVVGRGWCPRNHHIMDYCSSGCWNILLFSVWGHKDDIAQTYWFKTANSTSYAIVLWRNSNGCDVFHSLRGNIFPSNMFIWSL